MAATLPVNSAGISPNIRVTDMHTGGEPLRIIECGYPPMTSVDFDILCIHGDDGDHNESCRPIERAESSMAPTTISASDSTKMFVKRPCGSDSEQDVGRSGGCGGTLLDKRNYIREKFDHLRKLLMWEPRGHMDMYGVLLVPPDHPGADLGAIFMHNQGYSTMCGHAVIALGRYAVDKGIIKNPWSPETAVTVQCPCGPVAAYVQYENGRTGAVRFHSVPAFVVAMDVTLSIDGVSDPVRVDVGYGGAFYALVDAACFGLDARTSKTRDLVDAANKVSAAIRKTITVTHPESPDLSFLYGTIITDGQDAFSDQSTANVCVFADSQIDRSPTGSGVTARIALQYQKGMIQLGNTRSFESGCTGSLLTGKPIEEVTYYGHKAVIVEVSGHAYYTGTSEFILEDDDEIGKGFLIR